MWVTFFRKKYLWITIAVNILISNELVKLTMLWTTEPNLSFQIHLNSKGINWGCTGVQTDLGLCWANVWRYILNVAAHMLLKHPIFITCTFVTFYICPLPLKRQEELHLKMSSVYVVCWIFLQTFQTYFCIQANSVDPDQTAPKGAVWSGSTLFAKMTFKITSRWQSRWQ